MTEVWLVRHGQTDWNLQGRLQGWTDIPLNGEGIRQAHTLGFSLQGILAHHLYTSDLTRAYTTAVIVGSYLHLPVKVDTRLRERSFGAMEGFLQSEIQIPDQSNNGFTHSNVTEGDMDIGQETDTQVLHRGLDFLTFVRTQHMGNRIICVSHGRWIRILLQELGVNKHDAIGNTHVTSLVTEKDKWRLTGHFR